MQFEVHGSRYNRPAWFPNIGLANYIEKDGFFQIYYGDSNDLGPNNRIINVTNGVIGSAGNPDQGVAVARAKISDVVAAAKQGKPVSWKKYHEGGWTEPGLAPGTPAGCVDGCKEGSGKFTALNLPPQGYMHGDAAYNAALKQWCIVVMSGGRIQMTEKWRKDILIAFSSDGLVWSDWQTVFHDNHSTVVYPSLMALEGEDNEVLGKTFAVVYEYRGGNSSGAPFQFSYVNVTATAASHR